MDSYDTEAAWLESEGDRAVVSHHRNQHRYAICRGCGKFSVPVYRSNEGNGLGEHYGRCTRKRCGYRPAND